METPQRNYERHALSVEEAARALNLSRATIYRLIKDKRLETVKVGSRRLVRPQALDALLDGGAAE